MAKQRQLSDNLSTSHTSDASSQGQLPYPADKAAAGHSPPLEVFQFPAGLEVRDFEQGLEVFENQAQLEVPPSDLPQVTTEREEKQTIHPFVEKIVLLSNSLPFAGDKRAHAVRALLLFFVTAILVLTVALPVTLSIQPRR